MSRMRFVLMIAMCCALGGCGWFRRPQPAARPLHSDASYQRPVADADAGGAIVRAEVRDQARVPTAQSSGRISPGVEQAVSTPMPAPTATAPVERPGPARTTAQYMTLGAVVTEVSGTPIYADKVLQTLTPLLSTEAKQRTLDDYRALARREIEKQVRVMINDELEYAAASKNLGKDEQTFADNLTMYWRQQQITAAGGSLEIAKRKAQEEGLDFDEKVQQQRRLYLVQIYYQRKVFPKVQITAEDMRRYYDQHVKTEFTQVDEAQFRLIKITAKNMGSVEAARQKATEMQQQAARGEDFAKLAGSINHDPALLKSAGFITADGWIQRGAYANARIEDEVWKLQPGQVSGVIDVGGDTFYIAKLEDRKLGRVQSFEEEDVQKRIRDTLTRQQMAIRREQVQQKLMQDSVIYPNPPLIDPVVEMALQKYPAWAEKKDS